MGFTMTAPEALAKELRGESARIAEYAAPNGWAGRAAPLLNQAADMIEALSAPAVTVTEDVRNGDYSDDISPEAFETLRKSVEGVNSSRLDRAVETLNNYTVSDRFPRNSDGNAVLEEAARIADAYAKDAKTFPRKWAAHDIAESIRALKSTTPQTGSI